MTEALAWMESHPPKLSDRSIEPGRRIREEAVQLAAQQWYEDLLERHPGLQIELRDVPDERNGLLQLAELVNRSPLDSRGGMAAISEEIIEMIEGRVAWDPEAFREWSNQNRELMDTVLAISEMPDRSARGITLHDPLAAPPQFVSDMGALLRATGRLAFDDGDEDLAFRYHAAAMNLAAHLDQAEITSMLSVVVAHQIRQSVRTAATDHLLPAMCGSEFDWVCAHTVAVFGICSGLHKRWPERASNHNPLAPQTRVVEARFPGKPADCSLCFGFLSNFIGSVGGL